MVTSMRVVIGWVVVLAGILTVAALADRSSATEYGVEVDEARRQADELLREVDKTIARLESGQRRLDARPLADQAARLRIWLAAPFHPPPSSTPELHAVGVQIGGVPPTGVASEAPNGVGYAEVRVSVVGRPVVLALSSHGPMHWHIVADPKVQLLAVLLAAASTADVSGLPEETLIINADRDPAGRNSSMTFAYLDRGEVFDRFEVRMRDLTGLPVESMTGVGRYDGRPLRVGPESAMWRSQVVVRLAERLREKAFAARAPLAAELERLRFSAIFYQRYPGGSNTSEPSVSVGDFTVKGPIASSLRSRSSLLSGVFHDEEEKTDFALFPMGLMAARPGETFRGISAAPLSAENARLAALTFDKRNRRLIAAARGPERALLAFDLRQNSWSQLGAAGHVLLALTYADELDVMFAITALPHDWNTNLYRVSKPGARKLLKLASDGRILAKIEPSELLDVGPAETGKVQLLYVDGKLVMLGRPRPGEAGRVVHPIQILDPQTGFVLYAGEMRPQTDEGRDITVPRLDYDLDQGRLARWIRGTAAAERTIADYRRSAQVEAAEKLARQLAEVRRQLATAESGLPTDEPELYIVSHSGARRVTLELTDTSRPIALAISSSASVFKLSVPEDVRLVRVFADRQILDVPPGVPVGRRPQIKLEEAMPILARSPVRRHSYSHHGHGVLDEATVVLGPEDGDWRLDRALGKLERLNSEHQVWPSAPGRATLDAVRFRAMYRFTALADSRAMASASAEFTIKGPEHPMFVWRHPVFRETYNAVGSGELLGWSADGLFGWDHALERMIAVAGENAPPEPTRIRAVAHDRVRDRLLATTEGSDGGLYAYRIDNRDWEIVRSPGIEAKAMCYATGDDAIYALRPPKSHEKSHRIAKYTAYGVRLGEMRVRANSPQPLDLGEDVQLADAGGFLTLVTSGRVDPRTSRVALPRLYLLDRETGHVLFTSLLREHARAQSLADREISEAYATLAEASDADAERVMWRLAGGGEKTVAFLAAHVGKLKAIDPGAIRPLIAKLDDEKFAVREQAQRDLAAQGAAIEPLLVEAAKSASAEVRTRVKRLLEPLHADPPVNPELRQQCRALEALVRAENPAATDLLRQLSETAASQQVSRRAKQLLDAPKTDEVKWDERNGRLLK